MTEQEQERAECVNCGKNAVQTVWRDKLFGQGEDAVLIERVPLQRCTNCGITYYEPAVSRAIDEILAHPDRHTARRLIPVAKIA